MGSPTTKHKDDKARCRQIGSKVCVLTGYPCAHRGVTFGVHCNNLSDRHVEITQVARAKKKSGGGGIGTLNLLLPALDHIKAILVLVELPVETTEPDHRAKITSVFIMRIRRSSVGQLKDPLSPDLLDHRFWEELGPKFVLHSPDTFRILLLDYSARLSVGSFMLVREI